MSTLDEPIAAHPGKLVTHRQPPLSLSIKSPHLCEHVAAAMAGTGPEVILHGAQVEFTLQAKGAAA